MEKDPNLPKPTKKPNGRPPFYTDPKVMQEKIDDYFNHCDEGVITEVYSKKKQEVITMVQKIPYTVPGLSNYLGFVSRRSFLDYERNRKSGEATEIDREFALTIKRARQRIEQQRNEMALLGLQEPRFAQFDLKNNFGWKDQQNVQVDAEIKHGISDDLKALIEDIVA